MRMQLEECNAKAREVKGKREMVCRRIEESYRRPAKAM